MTYNVDVEPNVALNSGASGKIKSSGAVIESSQGAEARKILHIPYKGLDPYTATDASIFFGRDDDIQKAINSLLAWRLTILYGKSGVGKSSVLRAGVTHRLTEEAQQNIADYGAPKLAVVVFPSLEGRFSWRDDALTSLKQQIEETIAQCGWDIQPPEPGLSFVETLRHWADALGGEDGDATLYLILDQFEEYFLYHAAKSGEGTFFTEFSHAVNCSDLQVNFLVAIREDSLAALDRFKQRIPRLFEHRLEIGYLDGSAAREAITQPIEFYNQQHGTAIVIEPELVNVVLDQVQVGKVVVGETGRAGISDKSTVPSEMRIETPYLQLVMERLWQADVEQGSTLLRLETFKALGEAERIVKDHLNHQMALLTDEQKQMAADIFQYLVTLSGMKCACSVSDLADNTGCDKAQIKELLEQLASGKQRILRPEGKAKPDQPDTQPYEIFHDALAKAILAWRRQYLEKQKLETLERKAATLAEKQRIESEKQRIEAAKQQAKTERRWGSVLLATSVAAAAIVGGLWVWSQRTITIEQLNLQGSQVLSQWETADQLQTLTLAMQAGWQVKTKNLEQQVTAPTLALQQILTDIQEQNQWLWPFPNIPSGFGSGPDGQWLAIATLDGQVYRWNLQQRTWTPLPLNGARTDIGQVLKVDLNRNGERIATGSNDGKVRVWSAEGQPIEPTPEFPAIKIGLMNSPEFSLSPDSQTLAIISEKRQITLWDLKTGQSIRQRNDDLAGDFIKVKFSPDGRQLATVSRNKDNQSFIALWDRQGNRLRQWQSPQTRILDISFSPVPAASPEGNGQRLATAAVDKTTVLWDLQSQKNLQEPQSITLRGHRSAVSSVGFTADGKYLITGAMDGFVRVWDLDGTERFVFRGHDSEVRAVGFSPDGQQLTTLTRLGTVNVWSLQPRQTKPLIQLPAQDVRAVSQVTFSSDGQRLVTASLDGVPRLWNLQGQKLHEFSIGGSSASPGGFRVSPRVFLSPNEQQLAAISSDGTAYRWAVNDQSTPEVLFQGQADQWAVGLNFKANSPQLVTTTEQGLIRIWDFQGHQLKDLKGHQNRVADADFSPVRAASPEGNGRQLATASQDNTARLWDLQSGKFRELKGHSNRVAGIRFSPDGRQVATASWDGTARIWDLNGRELKKIDNRSPVMSVNFSPDGQRLVTASWNNTARIWDLQGHQLAEYRSQAGLWDAVFSPPDGRQIAAGGWGGSVILWPVKDNLDQLLKDGCDWMQDYRANPTNPPELKQTLKEICPD